MTTHVYIGLEITSTLARAALVSSAGAYGRLREVSLSAPWDAAALWAELLPLLRELAELSAADGRQVAGLGLALRGRLGDDGQVLACAASESLVGQFPAQRLARALQVPVRVLPPGAACVLAEVLCGAASGASPVLALSSVDELDGGLWHAGRLWRGAEGLAGDLEHFPVVAGGRPCSCGSSGCLGQYLGAAGLARSYRQAAAARQRSRLNTRSPDPATLLAAARTGDPAAMAAWTEGGVALGRALAQLDVLANFDRVVLCGLLAEALPILADPIQRGAGTVGRRGGKSLPTVAGRHGEFASLIGAALSMVRPSGPVVPES